jgi:hypothetical protein
MLTPVPIVINRATASQVIVSMILLPDTPLMTLIVSAPMAVHEWNIPVLASIFIMDAWASVTGVLIKF